MAFLPPRPSSHLLAGLSLLGAAVPLLAQVTPGSHSSWFAGPSWISEETTPLQWGRFELKPSAFYSLSHSTGEPGRATVRGSTTIQRLSPSLVINYGRQWSFRYSPSWTYYSSDAYSSRVNHAAALSGGVRLGIADISVSQTYSKSTEALIETARQTDQASWGSSASIRFPIRQRLSAQFSGSRSSRDAQGFNKTTDWLGSGSLNYAFSSYLSSGVGFSSGYTEIEPGPDQTSDNVYLTFGARAGTKLSFSGNVGHSNRRSRSSTTPASSGLTYAASANYQLQPATSLGVSLSRNFGSTFLSGQTSQTQRISFSATQRLLGRFNLSLAYSVGTTDYEDPLTVSAISRDDTTESWSANLSVPVNKRLSLGVFYRKTTNDSNRSDFVIDNSEYGASVTYKF